MIQRIKNIYYALKKNVFEKYPVTMVAIWIASLMSAITFQISDHYYNQVSRETVDSLEKVLLFLWLFVAGALFTEEFLRKKKISLRLVGFGISAGIAAFITTVAAWKKDLFLGMDHDKVVMFCERFLVVYLVWIAALCIYRMYRESQEKFRKYCVSVFGSVMKVSIVYGMFALGIALIILIVDVLLYDRATNWTGCIEIFLAGALYVPGVLMGLSKVQEEIGKFLGLVIKYVLYVLTFAAFIIIYLYIFKLILTWELPSNEVFLILGVLFAIGMPIWTMTGLFEDNRFIKTAKYMPVAFIPFVLLQALCIGLRIGQYGLTESRYMGVLLVVFEACVLTFFLIKKEKFLPLSFLAAALLVTVAVAGPFSMDRVEYRSQKHCIEKALNLSPAEKENLDEQQCKRIMGAYYVLNWNTDGKAYLDNLSTADKDWLKEVSEKADMKHTMDVTVYISGRSREGAVDISGYSKMYDVALGGQGNHIPDNCIFRAGQDIVLTADLTDYLTTVKAAYEEDEQHFEDWFAAHNTVTLPDGKLIIRSISLHLVNDEYSYCYMDAYYLVK